MRVGARNRAAPDMVERVGQRHVNGYGMGGRYKPGRKNVKGNSLYTRMMAVEK
jgi:hypothetical protein